MPSLIPKFLRVLQLLNKGCTVQLKGWTLAMGENGQICLVAQKQESGKAPEEILLDFDCPINVFIEWCEELSESEIPIVIPR